MPFSSVARLIQFGFALCILASGLKASPGSKVIRSPFPEKTPCGLYLTTLRDSSAGVQVADATIESIEAYLSTKPDFAPRLVYVDKASGKVITDPQKLRDGLSSGTVKPVIERPQLFIVGLPLWGQERTEVVEETKRILREHYPDQSVPVRTMGRPVARMKHLQDHEGSGTWWRWLKRAGIKLGIVVDLAAQNVVYELPLPQFDYQKPTQGEVKTMGYKLLVSNGSQQVFLFMVKPWYIALNSGLVNIANSAVTGTYEKWMGNWFNRSRNEPERLVKNAAVSGFFTADLYWASQKSWDAFLEITTWAGWKAFALAKWPGVVFQVGWRYFLGQSLYRWEREMEERGRAVDGRRTRNRLSFIATLVTTPAFIYATVAQSWFPVEIFGKTLMTLNEGHFFQLGVGALGALYYYGVPRNLKWYWNKATITAPAYARWLALNWKYALSLLPIRPHRDWTEIRPFSEPESAKADPMPFTWDPWVERLDRVHAFNQKWAAKVGLKWLVDKIEAGVRGVFSFRQTQDEVLEGDIRNLIDLDPKLEQMIAQDAEVLRLIQQDPELVKLAKTDPHFDEIVVRMTRKKK